MKLLSKPAARFYIFLGLLAICATAALLYSTPEGLGLNDDSIAYVAGARSLLSGQGYREIWLASAGFVTHFPPGFSSALAIVSLITGIDPLRSARLLNALLFGLNTFLIGWLALRMTKSQVVGLLTAALFLLTPSILRIHSNAMSEPLYVFFTLLAFLLLDLYFFPHPNPSPSGRGARREGWLLLVVTGSIIGLAYLTRYAALALLATGIVALFILHSEWRKRFTSAGILLAGFLPWAVGWAIRNRFEGGSLTNRALGWHPITADNARMGIRTFAGFVMPVDSWLSSLIKINGLVEIILIALGLGLLFWTLKAGLPRFFRPGKYPQPEVIPFLNGLYIFGYFLSLAATMAFFDPATKFQLRIVAPIFVSLVLLLAYGLNRLAAGRGRAVAVGAAAVVLAVTAIGFAGNVQDLRRGGQVYANERWYGAPAIAVLRQLPADVAIHSNQPGVIYLYTNRPGEILPEGETDISALKQQVLAGKAVIVIFKSVDIDATLQAYYDELGAGLHAQKYNGDVIYSAP